MSESLREIVNNVEKFDTSSTPYKPKTTLSLYCSSFDRLNKLSSINVFVEGEPIQKESTIIRISERDFLTKRKTGRIMFAYVMTHERLDAIEGLGNVDKYHLVKI